MSASSLANRRGLTLLEVLITIFVMGIGMLSVLTLFPLAARKISMSIDMDRATQMAANASALCSLKTNGILSIREASQLFFDEALAVESGAGRPTNIPSSVVYYDGAGFRAGNTSTIIANSKGIFAPHPRPGKPWAWPVLGPPEIVSLDEYPFDDAGVPEPGSRRAERYSSSFMFRRNRLDDETSMETVILVYAGRPIEFGNRNELQLSLTQAGTSKDIPNSMGSTEIRIKNPFPVTMTGTPDRVIQRGSWIMDVSLDPPNPNGIPRWKKFYRVVSVDPATGVITIDRDLESDLRAAIWLDYLVDWFDRGTAP